MERRNGKEPTENPVTVHVWLCLINGSSTGHAVRARYTAAQAWVEHVAGCPNGKWRNGESVMQHFVGEDGAVKGVVEPAELPEVAALLIEEGDNPADLNLVSRLRYRTDPFLGKRASAYPHTPYFVRFYLSKRVERFEKVLRKPVNSLKAFKKTCVGNKKIEKYWSRSFYSLFYTPILPIQ